MKTSKIDGKFLNTIEFINSGGKNPRQLEKKTVLYHTGYAVHTALAGFP